MSAADRQGDEGRFIVNKAQLAHVVGVSDTTITRWIAQQDDFPVKTRGNNGVAYEFDVRDVKAWIDRHNDQVEAERDAEREKAQQLRLEFFGEELGVGDGKLGPKEEREYIQARYEALRLAKEQGKVLIRSDVEEAIAVAFIGLREELEALPVKLSRELSLKREDINWLDEEIAATLLRLANRLRDGSLFDQPESDAA